MKNAFKVSPVIEMAERKIRADGILPDYVKISWMKYDDKCDPAIATISAIDAYAKNCTHLIIGPSCEYSVCKSSSCQFVKSDLAWYLLKLFSLCEQNRKIFLQRWSKHHHCRSVYLRLRGAKDELRWSVPHAASRWNFKLWENCNLHHWLDAKFQMETRSICLR